MKDVHEIDSLEQVRLLSDPLKLKLLQVFATAPRTTREAAKELGEALPTGRARDAAEKDDGAAADNGRGRRRLTLASQMTIPGVFGYGMAALALDLLATLETETRP